MQRNVKFNNYNLLILLLCFYLVVSSAFSQTDIQIPDQFKLTTIVIDPGHGGHDSGTSGKQHKEKNLALEFALKVGKKISKEIPGVKVLYTRTTDQFIPLRERAQFANRNNADLFISIHCNGGSSSAIGTETFVLGLHRSEDNLKVAMRENNSILLEDNYTNHYGNFDPSSPEAYILFNMYQNANLDQSLDLASLIERQFSSNGRKSRGVKQAGFLVLRETTMPSILVETGFLTNRSDEKFMTSTAGKEKIVKAIFDAVRVYKKKLDQEAERIFKKKMKEDALFRAEQEKRQEEINRKLESAWAWPSLRTIDLSGNQFFIQVLVSKDYQKGKSTFHPFENIVMSRIDIIDSYKYLIGPYNSREKAAEIHKKAQNNGFRDAYILQFENGKLKR